MAYYEMKIMTKHIDNQEFNLSICLFLFWQAIRHLLHTLIYNATRTINLYYQFTHIQYYLVIFNIESNSRLYKTKEK